MMTKHDLLQEDLNNIDLLSCQGTQATCYMPQGVVTLPLWALSLCQVNELSAFS